MRLFAVTLLAACSADMAEPITHADIEEATGIEIPTDLSIEEALWYGTQALGLDYAPVIGVADRFGNQFCSGTLVKPDLVLTAAHCVDGTNPGMVKGGLDVRGNAPSIGVSSWTYYSGWNPRTLDNDIAAIYLDGPVPNYVKPIYPATSTNPLRQADQGRIAEAVGFGVDQNGRSGIRNRVDVPLTQINSTNIITNSANGGNCFGDSGGPLLLDINGTRRVVGVSSAVIHGPTDWCDGQAIYTRVDAFNSWLFSL